MHIHTYTQKVSEAISQSVADSNRVMPPTGDEHATPADWNHQRLYLLVDSTGRLTASDILHHKLTLACKQAKNKK